MWQRKRNKERRGIERKIQGDKWKCEILYLNEMAQKKAKRMGSQNDISVSFSMMLPAICEILFEGNWFSILRVFFLCKRWIYAHKKFKRFFHFKSFCLSSQQWCWVTSQLFLVEILQRKLLEALINFKAAFLCAHKFCLVIFYLLSMMVLFFSWLSHIFLSYI